MKYFIIPFIALIISIIALCFVINKSDKSGAIDPVCYSTACDAVRMCGEGNIESVVHNGFSGGSNIKCKGTK